MPSSAWKKIVTIIEKEFGVEGKIDPSQLVAANLKDIAQAIAEIAEPIQLEIESKSSVQETLIPQNELYYGGKISEVKELKNKRISKEDIEKLLVSNIIEHTGFPADSILPESRILDDFNINSIKATELLTKVLTILEISGQVDAANLVNASVAEITDVISKALGTDIASDSEQIVSHSALDILIEVASKITGFTKTQIKPQSVISDDLKFYDSNRQTDFLQTAAQVYGIVLNIDFEILGHKTLEDIAMIFENIKKASNQKINFEDMKHSDPKSTQKDGCDDIVESLPSTIRNLDLIYLPKDERENENKDEKLRTEDNWKELKILVIADKQEAISMALVDRMEKLGSVVNFATYNELESLKDKISSYYHVYSILPNIATSNNYIEQVNKSLDRLLKVAHTFSEGVLANVNRRRTTITFVQFGGGYFGINSDQKINIESSCATSFVRAMHMERSDLRLRVIDLCKSIDAQEAAQLVLDETTTPPPLNLVGFDSKKLRRSATIRIHDPKTYKSRNISWNNEDVVIFTGGAKGITAECALEFASYFGVKVALVGSSSLDSSSEQNKSNSELSKNIERFSEKKINFKYYSCDVTDELAVKDMIKRVKNELGPVTGFIHGAGVVSPRTIRYLTNNMKIIR